MMLSSDGRLFVFGVFSGDGCECETLEALHEDEDDAQRHADGLRRDPAMFGPEGMYGEHGWVEVRSLDVRRSLVTAQARQATSHD